MIDLHFITNMNPLNFLLLRILLLGAITTANVQAEKIAETIPNILPEGAFDTRTDQFFTGWKSGGFLGSVPGENRLWDNKVSMEVDDAGCGFARIAVRDSQGASVGISQTEALVLNPAWTTLDLKVSVRVADYTKVADWGGSCQFSLTFKNDKDQPIPGDFKTGISRNTSGWEEIGSAIKIPEGAASLSVEIQFMGATGVLDVKNIRVFADVSAASDHAR